MSNENKVSFALKIYQRLIPLAHQVCAYLSSVHTMKWLGEFLLLPGTHLYTWLERGTGEHNTARA